ncbi:MAG: hypothetical protein KDB27_29180 [Planctomycetales bacterium]|nr:hypothetical protein [Planctomycetales bacterium]
MRVRRERNKQSATFEFLENRHLLAGDLLPGDANMDFYLDEADIIQVMKFGKRDTGEHATWEEGDWTDDGVFDREDGRMLFNPNYVKYAGDVPYDADAGEPIDHVIPIQTTGVADVTLYYFPDSGTVTAVPADESKLGALHIVSKSNSVVGVRGEGAFDFSRPDQQFLMDFQGGSWIEFPGVLPPGWTREQILSDLLVDGAFAAGGDLGTVRLGNLEDFPSERPDDVLVSRPKDLPTFVNEDEANGLLTYDPVTGDMLIEAWGLPIDIVELSSPSGVFVGAVGAVGADETSNFEEATPTRFFKSTTTYTFEVINGEPHTEIIRLPSFTSINLPDFAETGLTADEFTELVHPSGTLSPQGRLNLALAIGPTFSDCREHLENETLVGDANLDGVFDSQDLVTIFQANEYRDDIPDNSTWSEGDWTCDGDFDTDDLVAAFQAGRYELPAAAAAAVRSFDDREQNASRADYDRHARLSLANQDLNADRLLQELIVSVQEELSAGNQSSHYIDRESVTRFIGDHDLGLDEMST